MAEGDRIFSRAASGKQTSAFDSTTVVTVVTSPSLPAAGEYLIVARGYLHVWRNGNFMNGTDLFVATAYYDAGLAGLAFSRINASAGGIAGGAGNLGATSMDISGQTLRLRFTPVTGGTNQNLTLVGAMRVECFERIGISSSP